MQAERGEKLGAAIQLRLHVRAVKHGKGHIVPFLPVLIHLVVEPTPPYIKLPGLDEFTMEDCPHAGMFAER